MQTHHRFLGKIFVKALFSFVKHPFDSDRSTIVRSLVFLRITILMLTAVFLVGLQVLDAVVIYWQPVGASFVLVFLWSVLVLLHEALSNSKNATLREMIVDFTWVFFVVMLTGRSANPFIYYYLVLTAISATTLPAKTAWKFCFAGICIYSGALILDVKQHFAHMTADYRVHLSGMWLHYVGSTLVTCFFVTRLSKQLHDQQTQLATAREDNLKNEQLIGIATVAASTVHTLATPISTLTVIAEELIHNNAADSKVREDADLMLTQIGRCRSTMEELSSLAQHGSEQNRLEVTNLVSFIEEHYSLHSPEKIPVFRYPVRLERNEIFCNTLFQYAIVNLINNALESGGTSPVVEFKIHENHLHICIENDSALSAGQMIHRWGKPAQSEKKTGLGIGSFLANSTIERQGGLVRLDILPIPENSLMTRIVVTISFPLVS